MSQPFIPARRAQLRLQEGGLLVVIAVIGLLLTLFGGSVEVRQFETNAQGRTAAGLPHERRRGTRAGHPQKK